MRFLDDYKCIKKDTEIDFGSGNYCALVGLNGSGKSSVLNYLLSVMLHQNNGLYPIYKSNIIGDYICTNNAKLPKLVVHIYNGETKFGSRFSYNEQDNIYILQLDSSIWCLASFILQIKNDTLIDDLQLKCQEVEDWIKEWENESEADYLDKLYNNKPTQKRIKNRLKHNENEDRESDFLEKSFNKCTYINKSVDKKIEDKETNFWDWILHKIGINFVDASFSVPPQHYIFQVVASFIHQNGKKDEKGIISVHSLSKGTLYGLFKDTTLQLSEGQKSRLVLQLALKYLAVEEKNTLFLLDEPDAYLDVQKKRDLFNLIRECKGQVIMSTHDPIMTKWMKGHLIFMDNGKQLPSKMVDTINELSDGELSYQETLLMLSECRHYVFAEGKTDIAFIKKAIEQLDYSKRFENITFLSLGSSSAVEDKYYTTISDFLPKDTQKILFLFDADWGGYQGKMQIDKLKAIREEYKKLCVDKAKKEEAYNKTGKEEIKTQIQNIENDIKKIKATNFDFLDKLTYYFYNKEDNFETKQNGDRMEWFYLEDYFTTNSYPNDYKVRKKILKII
ncbi:MAG: AAA family ATPase [Bacteroidales bacterium]|nr:AAA family ATPase [Bacteroidales bacterium]